METKKCTRCKQEKPLSEFGINRKSKNGYQSWCKNCHTEYWNNRRHPINGNKSNGRFKTSLQCELCRTELKAFTKASHFQEFHPEYEFESIRVKNKTVYKCSTCEVSMCNFKALVRHYQNRHFENETLNEVNVLHPQPSPDPIQNLDNFFNQVSEITTEIKYLRREVSGLRESNNRMVDKIANLVKERDNWKSRVTFWSSRLVELQNILARPDR